jgi:phage repressor protein C with HTH and peptisase S24 domain
MQVTLSMKVTQNPAMFFPMATIGGRIKWLRRQAKLTQEAFAKALSTAEGKTISRGAIGNWELGSDKPSADHQDLIAEKFGVSRDWLSKGIGEIPQKIRNPVETPLTDEEEKHHGTTPPHFQQNARLGEPLGPFSRIPIRGKGMGGKDGYLILGDQYLGDVLAPPALADVPDAYAVYVIGDSMLERYRHGELVYVHPYAPVRKDDDCVIQISSGEGEPPRGFVKRYISFDEKHLKVLQLNPRKIITFPTGQVLAVHRIIMGGPA